MSEQPEILSHGGARPGAGRKPYTKEQKRRTLPYYVAPETEARLKELATHYNISGGKVLDMLVKSHRPRKT